MKWLHGIAAVVFIACAALQWNDPDPWRWIVIYGVAAAAAVANYAGVRPVVPNVVALLVALGALAYAAPGALEFLRVGDWSQLWGGMSDERPWIESAREFIGALIIADYLAVALVMGLRRR